MKRIASVLLTLVMILGLTVSVFAADPTITVADDNRTYEVYQIFTGDLYEGTLSNIKWGENGKGTIGEAVPEETLDTLAGLAEKSDTEKLAVIEPLVNFESEPVATVTKTQPATVAPGYYLLKDVSTPAEGEETSLFVVKVVKSTVINAKAGDVTSEKKVKDTNDTTGKTTDWQDSADYDIGDDVPFLLKGTVSEEYANYDSYYYCFHDTLSEGLTFKPESVKVYVDGVEIEEGYTVVTTNLDDGCTFEVEFADLKKISAVKAGSVITVEYTATLNEKAVIGSAGNPNVMHLEYSNNPNDETKTGKTPEDKVIVFTYKLVINKVDEDDKPLQGADFTLYKKNDRGQWVEVENERKAVEGNTFTWTGLDDGDYKLVESKTPNGYNTMADIEFTITAEHEVLSQDPRLITLVGGDKFTGEVSTGKLTAKIINYKGTVLPETGAAGTMAFITVGAVLALIAVVFLVTRKKMSIYEN